MVEVMRMRILTTTTTTTMTYTTKMTTTTKKTTKMAFLMLTEKHKDQVDVNLGGSAHGDKEEKVKKKSFQGNCTGQIKSNKPVGSLTETRTL